MAIIITQEFLLRSRLLLEFSKDFHLLQDFFDFSSFVEGAIWIAY